MREGRPVIPEGPFGERVRAKLRAEKLIWLVTVGADGTPQPNPVWFVWDGDTSVLIYNAADAHRLAHMDARPNVSLHFDSADDGTDIVVLAGTAAREDAPPPDVHPDYATKYAAGMVDVSGSAAAYAGEYPVPVRVGIRRVRGF